MDPTTTNFVSVYDLAGALRSRTVNMRERIGQTHKNLFGLVRRVQGTRADRTRVTAMEHLDVTLRSIEITRGFSRFAKTPD